ncbi:FISUMP domain-containing protein [Fibrobacter sp.]|uniref:FISUMP domain-containing protein n=1 Tax=Fibrobacter sp. TaxID=35828 RepID=UPI0025C5DAFB|nr:FISUMP domain-containing protein [Fibrobacter sp.]MBR3071454.1 hypothetical protein [Fibrobacter sp.]
MSSSNKNAILWYAALFVATLLALMFTACSENLDDSPVVGTLVEQPLATQTQDSLSDARNPVAGDSVITEDSSTRNSGVHALFENISISGNATGLKRILSSLGWNNINSFTKLYELDSITLDTTDRIFNGSFDKSTGMIRFDSVSFNSPYVMVEICLSNDSECWPTNGWEYSYRKNLSLRKIVDLRKTQNVVVDDIGHLKSYRIVRLVQSGMLYEVAERQANRNILDAFGFFKNSFDLDQNENLNPDDSVALSFLNMYISGKLRLMMPSIGMYGSLDSLSDSVRQAWLWSELRSLEYDLLNSSENSLMMTVSSNFVAVLQGLGECTPAKEGTVVETTHKWFDLVCKSGDWGVENNVGSIDSAGMMTDLRDGKKYKTVSYDIMGITETWLAEDLMFDSSDGNYMFIDAIALDTSIALQSLEECFEYELAYVAMGADGPKELTARDSSLVQSICEEYKNNKGSIDYERFWPAIDSVIAEKGYFQGVCPDGWHLPSGYEWERLMRYITDTYDNSGSFYSAPMYLETAGFGTFLLPDDVYPGQTKETYYAMKPDSSYKATGFEEFYPMMTFVRFVYDYWDVLPRTATCDLGSVVRVRCVKN